MEIYLCTWNIISQQQFNFRAFVNFIILMYRWASLKQNGELTVHQLLNGFGQIINAAPNFESENAFKQNRRKHADKHLC